MADSAPAVENRSHPVVTLEDIDQSFGDVTVLTDISVQIEEREVTAVIGPNGSGKTTLTQILSGLVQPDSGTVTLRTDAERPVGYLPQAPRFRPVFTVEETLQFYADLLSTATDIEELMERVGLIDVRDRQVDALSGGMRRLLGIAQSLLGSPPLVVLDEPTSGLDPRMTRRLFDVMQAGTEEGTAVLLTTHDLTYASDADAVIVLDRGRLVAQGSPADLCADTDTDSLTEAFFSLVSTTPTVQAGVRDETE